MENGFLSLDEVLHGIRWDAKYATWDNFTGKSMDGYEVSRITDTKAVVLVLREAQIHAVALGYGLFLWDGHRPRTTIDCFLRWAAQPEDNFTREKFYPNIERAELIIKSYMASQSSRSHGNAIDFTLCRLDTGELISMGSSFGFMNKRSHHTAKGIGNTEV